jgi:DegV family protein with EDD domain
MQKIKLIIDSSCDLPDEVIKKHNIDVAYLNVSFGEETFVDKIEIDNKTFYERMGKEKELPKTSCPSPERYMKLFDCEEEEILVISLSSELSGTYSASLIARDTYLSEHKNKDIRVIDSRNGTVGSGVLVLRAVEMIEKGLSLDEITMEIESMKEEIVLYGSLDTVDNAIKGGRVNPIAGKLINALNFKIIVKTDEGIVKVDDKARGEQNSIKKVIEKIESKVSSMEDKIVNIGHANCLDKALKVKDILESKYNFKEILVSEIGAVIGTYTAEGAVLVSVL